MSFRKTAVIAVTTLVTYAQPVVLAQNLLPQVAQIIQHPQAPDQDKLKQNVFVGLLAITAPEESNYMAIGSQIVMDSYSHLKKGLNDPDQQKNNQYISTEDYYPNKKFLLFKKSDHETNWFACSSKNKQADQCVTQTRRQKQEMTKLTQKNTKLLDRYQTIKQLPYYQGYHYKVFNPLPAYAEIMQLSYLQSAQAIFAFDENDIDTGFRLLSEEITFAKRMIANDNTILGTMVGISLLDTQLNVIDSLLSQPKMQAHLTDPRWQTLLTPLNEAEQTALARAFRTESNAMIYDYYTDISAKLYPNSKKDGNESRIIISNTDYLLWQPDIEAASLTISQASKRYQQGKLNSLSQMHSEILAKQFTKLDQEYPNGKPLEKKLLSIARPDTQNYIYRVYDLQSKIALIQAKHRILNIKIQPDKVNAHLQKPNTQAQNPLTQQLFIWDAASQQLSTLRLNNKPDANGQKTIDVRVQIRL